MPLSAHECRGKDLHTSTMQAKACVSLDTLNHVPWDVIAGTVAAFWLFGTCNINTCGKAGMSRVTLNHDPWDIIAGTLAVLCLFDTCNTNTSGKACVSLETLNHVPWHTIAGAVPVFCLLATLKVRQEAKYASERCHFLQEMLRMALPSHCMYTTWERRVCGLSEGADHSVALQFLDSFGLPAKRPLRTMSATSGHAYCKILPPLMHTRRQSTKGTRTITRLS